MKKTRRKVLAWNRVVITENKSALPLESMKSGKADVRLEGRPITRIESGSFVGEMSLLTGQVPTATVLVERVLRL